jgi:hypothetical protein
MSPFIYSLWTSDFCTARWISSCLVRGGDTSFRHWLPGCQISVELWSSGIDFEQTVIAGNIDNETVLLISQNVRLSSSEMKSCTRYCFAWGQRKSCPKTIKFCPHHSRFLKLFVIFFQLYLGSFWNLHVWDFSQQNCRCASCFPHQKSMLNPSIWNWIAKISCLD